MPCKERRWPLYPPHPPPVFFVFFARETLRSPIAVGNRGVLFLFFFLAERRARLHARLFAERCGLPCRGVVCACACGLPCSEARAPRPALQRCGLPCREVWPALQRGVLWPALQPVCARLYARQARTEAAVLQRRAFGLPCSLYARACLAACMELVL